MSVTKEELITWLRNNADAGAYTKTDDPQTSHIQAEKLLIEYLNDTEIAEAWKEASGNWWYA
jgi:hypothetical protein